VAPLTNSISKRVGTLKLLKRRKFLLGEEGGINECRELYCLLQQDEFPCEKEGHY
jgi:hypothetical protein